MSVCIHFASCILLSFCECEFFFRVLCSNEWNKSTEWTERVHKQCRKMCVIVTHKYHVTHLLLLLLADDDADDMVLLLLLLLLIRLFCYYYCCCWSAYILYFGHTYFRKHSTLAIIVHSDFESGRQWYEMDRDGLNEKHNLKAAAATKTY